MGPATAQVVQALLDDRPLDRLRSAQAILRFETSVGRTRLEAACARALYFGEGTYRSIKQIRNAALDREPLPGETPDPLAHAYTFARDSAEFFDPSPVPEEVEVC